jgi:hypothetical protein
MKIEKMPAVSLTFFNPDRSLFGIDCEVLNMCDGIRPNKSFILSRYASISFGLIIVTLNINIKLKEDV